MRKRMATRTDGLMTEHVAAVIVRTGMIAALATLFVAQSVQSITLTVDGIERKGIYIRPSKGTGAAPVVFGFHGHGGNMNNARRGFAIESEWPEAVVVYLQGLPTPGQLTDPEGKKNGWQAGPGAMEDRDIHFFDAALKYVREHEKIDDKQIYAMGHSNGGGFTYTISAARPGLFAAIGVSAGGFQGGAKLEPVPVIHIGGVNDPLVKYRGQQLTVGRVRRINGCEENPSSWHGIQGAELFKSDKGDVVFVTHQGDHSYFPEESKWIVSFFKEHKKV